MKSIAYFGRPDGGESRRFIRIAVVLAIILGSIFTFGVQPASANGTHCAWVNPIKIGGRTIPLGTYCFGVIGKKTHVDYTLSSYNSAWIENPSERVDFIDLEGNVYLSGWTYEREGTFYGAQSWTGHVNGNAKVGSACGYLFSNGKEIASACNAIKV